MPTIHLPYPPMARQRHRPPLLLALILLILLVTGCVDDDTQDTMAPQDTAAPQDTTAPQARITFPGAAALTTATQLTVCGTAQDQRSITGVTVNGVPAISTDGFATWVAQVTLPLGMNEVVVGTIDEVGNTEARAAVAMITVVETLFPFENFRALGMAVEASGTLVVAHSGGPVETSKGLRIIVGVEPGAVVRVNPRTGARTIISDAPTGSGPALVRPILNGAIAVEASGAFVVPGSDPSTFDPSTGRRPVLVRVDPRTGAQTIISDGTMGGWPPGFFARSIAVEATGTFVVAGGFPAAVVRVDPLTGAPTIVSDATTGSGPQFNPRMGLRWRRVGRSWWRARVLRTAYR